MAGASEAVPAGGAAAAAATGGLYAKQVVRGEHDAYAALIMVRSR